MKKIIASFVMMALMAIALPLSVDAQKRCYTRKRTNHSRTSYNRGRNYNNRVYQTRGYSYQRPSFYRRHRNLINLGVATGGGALIGALAGGKKGAGVGALIGAGSGALYTYVLNKKKRRY